MVEILRGESAQVHRDVRQQGARQYHPVLQGGFVEERLQDTARGARRGGDIYLSARAFALWRGIPHIGRHRPGNIVYHHRRHIRNPLLRQFV